jgi:hypothetical protein
MALRLLAIKDPKDYTDQELADLLHNMYADEPFGQDPVHDLAAHSAATQLKERGFDPDIAFNEGKLVVMVES